VLLFGAELTSAARAAAALNPLATPPCGDLAREVGKAR